MLTNPWARLCPLLRDGHCPQDGRTEVPQYLVERDLLADLQIKVEVVDEEVHGNELAVEQEGLNKRTTSLSRGELAEAM